MASDNNAAEQGTGGWLLSRIHNHLAMSQVTYEEHLTFAVKASGLLAYASLASIIHAFIPALFPATAARIVIQLYKQRLEDHPNPKYQEMMQTKRMPPLGEESRSSEVTEAPHEIAAAAVESPSPHDSALPERRRAKPEPRGAGAWPT